MVSKYESAGRADSRMRSFVVDHCLERRDRYLELFPVRLGGGESLSLPGGSKDHSTDGMIADLRAETHHLVGGGEDEGRREDAGDGTALARRHRAQVALRDHAAEESPE